MKTLLSHRLRTCLVASVVALGVLTPAAAEAGIGTKVVSDCADDSKLSKKYTAAEYADALKNIPTDVDEYTDCRDVIRRAQLGLSGSSTDGSGSGGSGTGAGGTGGSGTGSGGTGSAAGTGGTTGGGSGSGGADSGGATGGGNGLGDYDAALATASPEERVALDKVKGSPDAVLVAGDSTRPDGLGSGDLEWLNSLPSPLVLVLLLMGLGTAAAAFPKLRDLVRTRLQRTA